MTARREPGLVAAAVAASIAFIGLACVVGRAGVARLDRAIELAVHRCLDSAVADVWARAASALGENASLIAASCGVAALALAKRHRVAAWVLLADAAVVIAESNLLKLVFGRERPDLFEKFTRPTSTSFPSGHALSALGVWGVIAAVVIALYPRARGYVLAVAIPVIASIGASRIYFGVHWPSDVLGGYLAAVPPFAASLYLLRVDGARRLARQRTPGESARGSAQSLGHP